MDHRDKYYIELAEIVHQAVVNWDPLALISGRVPTDEYDTLEKRFLSGLINSDSDENTIRKVKKNLEYYGIDSKKVTELEAEIIKILAELRKHTANSESKQHQSSNKG